MAGELPVQQFDQGARRQGVPHARTRRIQPAVLKKHLDIALRRELDAKEGEKKFISKDRKQEIREQVVLRLRSRTLPVPAVFDVIWNTTSPVIWCGSINSKANSLFEDIFALTFEVALEPQSPFFLATRLLGEEAIVRLENVEPTDFTP